MKKFNDLIDETTNVKDMEELESAADLFQYGLENGHYSKTQVTEFNNVYWKVKNRLLAYECAPNAKANILDIMAIVSSAPADIKEDKQKLTSYVNSRIKAMKGNMKGNY